MNGPNDTYNNNNSKVKTSRSLPRFNNTNVLTDNFVSV